MFAMCKSRRRIARPIARAAFVFSLTAAALIGAAQIHAQGSDSQQSSQDVAEAARQARARKQQAAAGRHVYTNEDLHRSKILTPDDQARSAAAKEKQLNPVAKREMHPLDANSTTPQEPLGDVARRYRNARKISPFHLSTDRPELASPKIVAPIPELKPVTPARSQPPPARNFVVVKPTAPTSRSSSPVAPLRFSKRPHRIDPFVGRRSEPAPPSYSHRRPAAPALATPRLSMARPAIPLISSESKSQLIIRPGDTLWTISRQHLGRGTRWLELMAANPNLPDPKRLIPGIVLSLPANATASYLKHAAPTVTVQAGDTLTKLALATYGHTSFWLCIAHANPALANPDRLAVGQVLALPSSCQP